MSKRAICLIVTVILSVSVSAKDKNSTQNTYLEAEYFFLNEDYSEAISSYLQLYEKMPDNANLAYRIGVCYLNIPGKKNLSIEYLETASKNISTKYKEGTITQVTAPNEALYELAKAYRVNFMFDKAKETLQKYSATILPDSYSDINFVKHEMEVCDIAKSLINKPIDYSVVNMGELFNDEKANYNPIISADGKSFAYMSSLKFYNAIMFSRLIDGKWTAPVNITPDLQYNGDVYISCLSADGKLLFLSEDNNYDSDIYFSSFDGNKWTKTVKLNKNINTKFWESHGFVSEDGNQLVFASDRPEGMGGLDLYISNKVNGDWGPAINMGPEINTQFNEDRPFLINNGKTLSFSSQGHENIGGYDLFRSDMQSNGSWSKPRNIGYPINNPDDNIFFMPTGDGKTGFISTFMEAVGFGKEDIYKITLK